MDGTGLTHSFSKPMPASRVSKDPRFCIRPLMGPSILFGFVAILIIASLASAVANDYTGYESNIADKISKIVSVDREANVPAFFSMLLLLFAATLLGLIAVIKTRLADQYRWHWALLAFGFVYMAFDEIGEVHEKLIDPMRAALGGQDLGIFYFAWVVPAIAVVSIVAFVFFRFWWNLPLRTRLLFVLAGALFLSGAIGVEMLNGKYAEIYGKRQIIYQLLATIEEFLEMTGVVLFVYALLDYLARHHNRLEVHLTSKDHP